jgi:hypothetical protein
MPSPEWLAVFEAKALADALTRAGHSVSERTAQRWKKGETTPKPQDVRAILSLLGTTKEAAPPEWAERLVERVEAIYERQDTIMERQRVVGQDMAGRVIEALQSPDLAAWAQRIGERLAELPSQSDEASADQPGGSAPGIGARRDLEPS